VVGEDEDRGGGTGKAEKDDGRLRAQQGGWWAVTRLARMQMRDVGPNRALCLCLDCQESI